MWRVGRGAVLDMWLGGKVCLKPTCVFLDEVVYCWNGKRQQGRGGLSG